VSLMLDTYTGEQVEKNTSGGQGEHGYAWKRVVKSLGSILFIAEPIH
jgi:hypothetical protein